MAELQYKTDNTEGYSAAELAELNRIFEHRVGLLEEASVLDEDEDANKDILQHISETVQADYDLARDLVPNTLADAGYPEAMVVMIHDLELRGEGGNRAAVALVDLDVAGHGVFEGVLVVAYPDGEIVTLADWQSPVEAIPSDLRDLQWEIGGHLCVVGDDGLPRDAVLW